MSPEEKKEAVEEGLNFQVKPDKIHNILSMDKENEYCVMRELLGEDIRTKVWDEFKIRLEWEIERIGEYKKI